MCSKLTFLLASMLLYTALQAQDIHFGVTTNLNLTQTKGKGLSSGWQTGYNGGAYATIALDPKWSLQPEILYTLKNAVKADDFTTYYVNSGRTFANTNISLHYVSIPLLVNYKISKTLTLNAGPEYSRLIYRNDNLLKTDNSAFKKNEAGVNAGAQLAFSPSFSLFGSYYYGLTNSNDIDDRYKWHSNQLRIGLNVRIF